VVETLCAMLNAGVHPVIPRKFRRRIGRSRAARTLAHVVIGEGAPYIAAKRWKAPRLCGARISPRLLEAKEGLSLLNGTQGMLALLSSRCATPTFWLIRRT